MCSMFFAPILLVCMSSDFWSKMSASSDFWSIVEGIGCLLCATGIVTEYWCSASSSGRRLETGTVLSKNHTGLCRNLSVPMNTPTKPCRVSSSPVSLLCFFKKKGFGALIHLAVLLLDGNKGRLLSWARDQSALAYGQGKKGWNNTFDFKLSSAACFSLLKPVLQLKSFIL